MAIIYVDSNASGANDGTSWTDAYESVLNTNVVNAAAGSEIYWAYNSAETYTSGTLTFTNATAANPILIFTVDPADDSYRLPASAQLSAASSQDLTVGGNETWYFGPWLNAGDDFFLADVGTFMNMEDVKLEGTGGSSTVVFGPSNGKSEFKWKNVDLIFTNSGDGMSSAGVVNLEWNGGTVTHTGTPPTSFFNGSGAQEQHIKIMNVDLSDMAVTNIFDLSGTANHNTCSFERGVISSSTGLYNSIGTPATTAYMFGTDDTTGNDTYREEYAYYWGDITVDDANYLNASDGVTSYSWKVVTNAVSKEGITEPIYTSYMPVFIDSTGSKTITVEILTDNVTLQNDDIWLELEFLGSSSSPIATIDISDRVADVLAAPADQATSTEVWTSPGVTTDLEQKLVATVTVNRIGVLRARVAIAKPSTTVWIDAKVTVS